MNYDEEVPQARAMGLRQIEVFRAILMTGSISEAARSLYVAQPSVSRVLQVTESRVGFLLFERTRGRLKRSAFSRKSCARTKASNAWKRWCVRSRTRSSGKLNIVGSPSLGVHLVPRVLFGKNYIGVSMFEVEHPSIVTVPLESGRVWCVAKRGALAKRRTLDPKQIASMPWIDYEHDTPLGRIVGRVFSNTRRPEPVVRVRSAISACTLAREGVGVAIVDPFCIDADMRAALDVVPLHAHADHRLTASLLYSHVEPLSSVARRFVEILHGVLKQHLATKRTTSAARRVTVAALSGKPGDSGMDRFHRRGARGLRRAHRSDRRERKS